jgi:cell division protein FtsW
LSLLLANSKKNNKHGKKRKQKLRQNRIKGLLQLARGDGKKVKKRNSGSGSNGRKPSNKAKNPPDSVIIITTALLLFFGWIMVYSGSFYVASQRQGTLFFDNNPYHFFILQGIWIVVSTLAAFIVYKIPLDLYKTFVIPALLIIGALLILVLLRDQTVNGAKLWILIGPFSLQPSEFAKPVLIIYLAAIFAKYKQKDLTDFNTFIKRRILPFALVVLPIVTLILLGRDLATAALVAAISGVLFFMNDNHIYTNLTVALMLVIGVFAGTYFTFSEEYRLERVRTYMEVLRTGSPDKPLSSGYQLNQILTAVGSGGFDGYGFGQSRQKYFYLQETAFNDTIFAVVAEEFGFIGSVAVIFAFAVLAFRGVKIAQNAKSKYSSLLALGVSIWIFMQAVIHLGVNVGLFPLTGITLPFMSYGGSSLLSCMIGIGILLNVSKEVKLE